jgi:hypothetical protein
MIVGRKYIAIPHSIASRLNIVLPPIDSYVTVAAMVPWHVTLLDCVPHVVPAAPGRAVGVDITQAKPPGEAHETT